MVSTKSMTVELQNQWWKVKMFVWMLTDVIWTRCNQLRFPGAASEVLGRRAGNHRFSTTDRNMNANISHINTVFNKTNASTSVTSSPTNEFKEWSGLTDFHISIFGSSKTVRMQFLAIGYCFAHERRRAFRIASTDAG
jgi:hypothetical protein